MSIERLTSVVRDPQIAPTDLTISLARAVCQQRQLPIATRQGALEMLRLWNQYVNANNVTTDPYQLRAHLEGFASQASEPGSEQPPLEVDKRPLTELRTPDDLTPEEYVGKYIGINPGILVDPRVILYGGSARALLKSMCPRNQFTEKSYKAEVPVSDTDLMIIASDLKDITGIASTYGVEPKDTKIVPGARDAITQYIGGVTLTMDQVAISNGDIYFTQQALEDSGNGVVRFTGAEQPLFGKYAVQQPNGNMFILPKGMYPGLSMLLRGRASEFPISRENLDAISTHLDREWLNLLMIKLLTMSDPNQRDTAILHWHQVAKDIKSTVTESPAKFLEELLNKFPKYIYGKTANIFDASAQARWFVGKLVKQMGEQIQHSEPWQGTYPNTYTPSSIVLRPYEGNSDLRSFWDVYEHYKSS